MTLRLTIDTAAWERHIAAVADEIIGLVPVVKGNGYGFGRSPLFARAAALADTVAVGTVHELDVVTEFAERNPADTAVHDMTVHDVVVLTPTLRPPAPRDVHGRSSGPMSDGRGPILTVAAPEHIDAIDPGRHPTRVLVKVATSMRRYGVGAGHLEQLVGRARRHGLDVVGISMHLPIAGTDADRIAELGDLLPTIDPAHEVWLSHLSPEAYAALPTSHRYRLRVGTRLWHGDKSMLHLSAEVLDVRAVTAAEAVGYHRTSVPADGTLVMIGAGSAHGVHPLADGRSPFHHRRTRLELIEAPHMHTSMAFAPAGTPTPAIGERVDVQRPLITTMVDEFEWR